MFATSKILAVLAIAVLIEVTNGRAPRKIVGGSMSYNGEAPYQVSLRDHDQFFCGGAIVSKRHIITAAHCVTDITPEILTIATGSTSSSGGKIHAVSKIVAHPGYSTDDSQGHDIAIITLADDITFNWKTKKIDLPNAPTPAGVTAIVTGWGLTKSDVEEIPPELLKAQLQTISISECREMFGDTATIYDSQICTFVRRGLGTCRGDSGGPLAYNGKLIGVVSWGIPCATGLPDVFTSTFRHIDWIRQNMNVY